VKANLLESAQNIGAAIIYIPTGLTDRWVDEWMSLMAKRRIKEEENAGRKR
jgi:hypothetical protein